MSIPYRFKAGGSGTGAAMAPLQDSQHHHRSTTKQSQKPYKPRFASKGALKDLAKGKVEGHGLERGKRRTPHQQTMSKLARRNQAKQLRFAHVEKKKNEDSVFQGRYGVAKNVALIPLSADVDITAAIKQLNESVDQEDEVNAAGATRVTVERFRRNLLYLPAKRDLLNALDVCRLADWVVFVLSAEQEIDEVDDLLIRSIEGQGITNVVAAVQGLETSTPQNKRTKVITSVKASMSPYFPSLDKVFALDNKADSANLVRSLCTAASKGIRWRDERSWMVVENIHWKDAAATDGTDSAVVTGVVRGKGLNPDRLVHIPGWGDCQISRMTELPKESGKKKTGDDAAMDVVSVEYRPTEDQETLDSLAPEEVSMMDASSTVATKEQGVLLDDHHYFEDEDEEIRAAKPKRLPRGTSDYQAAWYLEDVSDSGSDITDVDDMDDDIPELVDSRPEDGMVVDAGDAMTEGAPSEYPESEMHVDATPDDEAADIEAFRASRKKEADEDLEFPDEIELSPDVLAKDRLAKYRGLKSLRTSEWNTEADALYQPEEYRRLLQIPDYKKSKAQVSREVLVGGVAPGTRVEVEISGIPTQYKAAAVQPTCMFSLLRHEHKNTVVNVNLTLNSDIEAPIKSKEDLVIQIGPRRFVINPVFSGAGNTPNDVHKFDRFVYPGRSAIASFVGPLTWGSVPAIVFRKSLDASQPLELIGTATTVPPSTSRVIAKRIVLTGHPYKIHKKLVTVRYMFFSDEDVAWFKALPLWTRRGRQGFIKESLGTHGYFKATFDGKINPLDAVGVSLYKRIWPRTAKAWNGEL